MYVHSRQGIRVSYSKINVPIEPTSTPSIPRLDNNNTGRERARASETQERYDGGERREGANKC